MSPGLLEPTELRRRASGRLREWREDPAKFAVDVFGFTPDPWQAEVFEAFPREQRIALVACANPGKTATLAILGWNFLATRDHPQCAATAITGQNLKANLWKELAFWYSKAPMLQASFKFGMQRIHLYHEPETWFLDARTWNRQANEKQQGQTLAGLHGKHVLCLLDEAGGIPSAVAKTAENTLGGDGEAHVILAGNPLELSGPLHEAAVTNRARWWTREITGDPDRPDRAPRVNLDWAREQIETWGREDYNVQVYVLGQFPSASASALIPLAHFRDAVARFGERANLADEPLTLGVDVAREGPDLTVVIPRRGDIVEWGGDDWFWRGKDTSYTAGRVAELAQEFAGSAAQEIPIFVDDIGVGGGVTDKLLELEYNAVGVRVDQRPTRDPQRRHANLKSQLGGELQERFTLGNIAIAPEYMDETTLLAEAVSMHIGYTGGRRKLEGKAEYKKRTGKSPDWFDALLLSFADSVFDPGDYTWI